MIGRVIDGYRVTEELGAANYGFLYQARSVDDPEEVVLLKLLDRSASDYEFRRLSNEIRLYAQTRSPHLAAIVTAGFAGGILYYAMCPYDGTLEQATDVGTTVRLQAVAGAARGAHALHDIGVAHRDIRPATIAIDGQGGRLVDLGLAQLLPGGEVSAFGPRGTVEFLAPEVVLGGAAGRASDVWSLGLVLHQMLSAAEIRPAPPDGSLFDQLRHMADTRPTIDDRLPAAVGDVVARCVAEDPTDRYGTALQLAEAIERLTDEDEVRRWPAP